jgi:uncharacterized membrane protein YfcA
VKSLTPQVCKTPELLSKLCFSPKWNVRAGADIHAVKTTGTVALFAMGLDTALQYLENGNLDTRRIATTGMTTFGSAFAGNYVGTQTSLLLTRSGGLAGKFAGPLG